MVDTRRIRTYGSECTLSPSNTFMGQVWADILRQTLYNEYMVIERERKENAVLGFYACFI